MDWLLSPWAIFGAGFSLTAIFAALWFLAPGLLPALLATRLGRYIAAAAGVIFAIWFAAMKLYQAGKKNVKDSIHRDSIERDQKREARDAELKNLDDDALRKRAGKWMRD